MLTPRPARRPRRTLARCLSIAAGVLGLIAAPADASTVPYRTDGDLVALSSRVVHGRVLSVTTERAENHRIYTVTRLAVIEDLTGVDESVVEIRELGGRVGDDEMFVAGMPGYAAGQEVLLFLDRGPRGLRTVAMAFSAFHVVSQGLAADSGVIRFSAGLDVLGNRPESTRARTMTEMRTIVAAIKGTRSVRPSMQADLAAEQPRVEAPFTLLGSGSRWRQADSATTVNWYRNIDYPSPLTTGSIDTEISTAAAAWTNPTTASLILANGGTRSGGSTDVFCTGVNSGAGLITFEDPQEDAGAGVLAIGGFCASGPT